VAPLLWFYIRGCAGCVIYNLEIGGGRQGSTGYLVHHPNLEAVLTRRHILERDLAEHYHSLSREELDGIARKVREFLDDLRGGFDAVFNLQSGFEARLVQRCVIYLQVWDQVLASYVL